MPTNDFIFDSYAYNAATGELSLRYAFEGGPEFEEKIVFPLSSQTLSANDQAALEASFRLIFLLAGISYYKAYIPERMICRAFSLDQDTTSFIEKAYRLGLAELAYRNKIDLRGWIKFDSVIRTDSVIPTPDPRPLSPAPRLLVPVGGGKDSIVTLECLKRAKQNITLFALGASSGPAEPIRATIETSGLPFLYVARALSPNLIDLNRQGALNGHVPITAILSSIAAACALLRGFDTIVLSNEHSASAPNVRSNGIDVNHQYSKSFEFEKDFAQFVHAHITQDLTYFSLLRPLTETAIAQRFARLSDYHAVFRSCNAAFRQDTAKRNKNWCCNCPKCRFVFLALAPFMDKEKLIAIFGKNLLSDATQTEGFADLCGLGAHKPFECVGEIEESALLMQHLAQSPAWQNDAVVATLSSQVSFPRKRESSRIGDHSNFGNELSFEDRFHTLFKLHPDHLVPAPFLEMLRACG